MPNHETNNVVIIGDPDKIRRFVNEALKPYPVTDEDNGIGKPERIIDFNLLMPMPDDLRNTVSPHDVVATQEEADQKNAEYNAMPFSRFGRSDDDPPQIKYLTMAEVERRLSEYGSLDWYSWALSHWGTKWGAYSHSVYELGFFKDYEDNVYGRVDLRFETAWSQPTPIFAIIEFAFGVKVYAVTQDEGGFPDVYFPDEETVKDAEVLRREVTYTFDNWDNAIEEPVAEVQD